MTDYRKEFLIAEYGSLMEHFRSYQSNRLNVILVGIPISGAIALNAFQNNDLFIVILSSLMLYGVPVCQILVDKVYMKRLRKYSIRLASIEKEFEVVGYSRGRLDELQAKNNGGNKELNPGEDATTININRILHFLNGFVTSFAIFQAIKFCYLDRTHYISDPQPWISCLIGVPIFFGILLARCIQRSVSTKGLEILYESKTKSEAVGEEATQQNTGLKA